MKAYYLSIKDNEDEGTELVFANTVQEARKQVNSTDFQYDSWIEVQAHRAKTYDGMENLTDAELAKEMWRKSGWQWFDRHTPDPDETTDDEFIKWYKKEFLDA